MRNSWFVASIERNGRIEPLISPHNLMSRGEASKLAKRCNSNPHGWRFRAFCASTTYGVTIDKNGKTCRDHSCCEETAA